MPQAPLFAETGSALIELSGARLRLERGFLGFDEASQLFDALLVESGWRQDQISLYGKTHPVPRLHRWFADSPRVYQWSGIVMHPEPFPPALAAIRRRIEASAGVSFNSALGNLYRDGRDSVSWHADDEPELGHSPVIASLSLGAERQFVLRRKDDHRQRHTLVLPHGSLLVMSAGTQTHWEHCVPKTRQPVGARINLTFRTIQARHAPP
jgi:alkylated DNA repair dioxygenase AlkB